MPRNQSQINIGVKYNVDKKSVNDVRKSLQDLQNIKITDFSGSQNQLIEIQQTAKQVQKALINAFNPSLNTVNLEKFKGILSETGRDLNSVYADFSKAGIMGKDAFGQMTSQIIATNTQLIQTKTLLTSMGQTMMNTVKWGIASSIMNTFTGSVQQAFQYVKSLDSALNDIRIVTGQNTEQMAQFAVQANNAAQSLGRSTMDYTKAALTFYQQGLDEASVQTRTESVLKAQNITGAGQEMADYLTAVWNGYKVANEEAELYVDKLAAVADSSASNMSQLAVAMSKVASTANALGVSVDSLNAQIATITATTRQAPETVGNALKTIYARINDIKTGVDDAQISLGNYSGIMAELGFSVLDTDGHLKDTGVTLEEIGQKWATLSREQQIYLARTMAGQRQYNNLIALFDNWSRYSDLVNVSMQAQGATAEKNAIYLDSLGAKLEQLGTAGERVKAALIDEQDLKGLTQFGTNIVNIFASLIEGLGGGANALLSFGGIVTAVFSNVIGKEIGNFINQTRAVKASLDAMKQSAEATRSMEDTSAYKQNPIFKKYIDNMEQMQTIWSVMSKEEIKAQQRRYNSIRSLEQQAKGYKETAQAGQKLVNVLSKNKDFDLSKNDLTHNLKNKLQEVQVLTEVVSSQIEDLINPDLENNWGTIFDNVKQDLQQLEQITGITLPKNVQDILNKGSLSAEDASNDISILLEYIKQIQNAKIGAQTFKPLEQSARKAEGQTKKLVGEVNQAHENAQTIWDAQGVTKFVSGLTRVATGISSIVNLYKTWKNENISTGQKILQTITTLSFVLPSVASGFKDIIQNSNAVSNSIKILAKKIIEVQAAENTATGAKIAGTVAAEGQAAANLSLASSFITIISAAAPYLVLIGAIVAAGYALYKEWNKESQAAQKAAKVAQQTKKTYDDLKSSFDDLKSSLENYNSAQEAIAEMTKGTQEWRDAIRESNDAVLQLIQNYPELANQVQNINGRLIISESAQKQVLQNAADAVDAARLANISANAESRNATLRATARESSRFVGVQYYDTENGAQTYREASTDQVLKVAQVYQQSFSKNTEEMVKVISESTGVEEDMVKAIVENVDNLQQLGVELKNNTQATKLAYETMASERLQNNATYQGFDQLGKQVANSISGNLLQSEQDRIKDTILSTYNFTRFASATDLQNVLDRYNKATNQNASFASNAVTAGGNVHLIIDGQNVTYSKQQIAKTIAAAQALETLGNSAKQASEMLSNMDKTGSGDALKNFVANRNLENLSKQQLQNLNAYSTQLVDFFNKYYAEAGFQGGKAFQDAFLEAQQGSLERFDKVGEGFLNSVSKSIQKIPKTLSLGATQNIANALNQAFLHGGEKGLSSLEKVISNLSKDELQKFSSIFAGIDWNQVDAADKLTKILQQQGIVTSQTAKDWAAFTTELEQVSYKANIVESSLNKVKSALNNIKEVKNLKTGDIISEEEYQTLVNTNPQLEKFFEITSSGYMFFNNSQQNMSDMIKDSVEGTIESFNKMKEIAQQITSGELGTKASSIDLNWQGFNNDETLLKLTSLTNQEGFKNALGYLGISEDSLQQALKYFKDHYNTTLTQMTEDQKAQYEESKQIIQNALDSITGLQGEYLQGSFSDDALSSLLATSAENIEELDEIFETGSVSIQDYLRNYQRLDQIQMLKGIDLDELKDFSEYIQEIADESEDLADSLQENSDAAKIVAQSILKMNDGIETLSSNFENWKDILEKSTESSEEYYHAIEGTKEALGTLLDISSNYISNDFVKQHLEEISKAAQGDAQAIESLRNALADDIIAKIAVENDLNNVNELTSLIDSIQAEIPNIEVGTEISLDGMNSSYSGFVNMCNQLIKSAGLTVDQANALFDALGFEAKFKTQQQPVKKTGRSTITESVVEDWTTETTPDGGTITYPSRTVTRTSPGQPYEYTDYVDAFAMSADGSTPVIESITKKANASFNNGSRSNAGGSSKKGGSGKKSGGSTKKPAAAKKYENKVTPQESQFVNDPYQQQNKHIEKQSEIIKQLQRDQKKLTGEKRRENLEKQADALEKQAQYYQDLLDAEKDASRENSFAWYREQLQKAYGDIFDQDGQIADKNALKKRLGDEFEAAERASADAFQKLQNEATDWEEKVWGTATAAQQQVLKAQRERREKEVKDAKTAYDNEQKQRKENYDKALKLIDNYDKAYKDHIEYEKALQESLNQAYQQRIAASKIRVDLAIDTGDLERQWLDFENKVIKKLSKDDILGNVKADFKQLTSYFDSGQINKTLDQINTIKKQINIMQQGGTSSIYGDRISDARADLEQYLKKSMQQFSNIQDLVDGIKEKYLDALDDAKKKLDDQIDQYERVNKIIDHNVKLTQLLYGDKAYDTLNKYYEMQKKNNEQELQSLKAQQDYWQSMLDNEVVGSDSWKKIKEHLDDITDDLNSKLEQMIENLSTQFENNINGIIDRLNNAMTGGRGLQFVDDQWDMINNYDDQFLDPVESKMGIEQITRIYQQAFDDAAGNPKAQQKINGLMNDQLKILKEKDHLTQYDLDRAKASLEVEKARMALEDSRYSKTKMRLRRDSQGNYTYQYVADEQKLGDLQSALADAQANLYNMDKEHYKENLNNLYDTYKDFLERRQQLALEMAATEDKEEQARIQRRIDLLEKSYNDLMNGQLEDNKFAVQYLTGSTLSALGLDLSQFTSEQALSIMTNTVPQAAGAVQKLADKLTADGGLLPSTSQYLRQMNQQVKIFGENVNTILEEGGTSLEVVSGEKLDQNIKRASELVTSNEKLLASTVAETQAMQTMLNTVDQYLDRVQKLEDALPTLRSAYNLAQAGKDSNLTADEIVPTDNNLDTTNGMNFTGDIATDTTTLKNQVNALMAQFEKVILSISGVSMATGGYTGDWGETSGRLAFLHQKELVLNEQDTLNILAAVNAVREITSSLNSINSGQLSSIAQQAMGFGSGINTNSQLDQNVHIEANFPNVREHTEIEQAFNNLVNMASMRASGYRD